MPACASTSAVVTTVGGISAPTPEIRTPVARAGVRANSSVTVVTIIGLSSLGMAAGRWSSSNRRHPAAGNPERRRHQIVLTRADTRRRRFGRPRRAGAEKPEHGGQHRPMTEQAQMAAACDEQHSAAWAVSGIGRGDERVGGGEDRELLPSKPVAEVRGTERDQPANGTAVFHFYEVAGDEAAEAMPHHVDLARAGGAADRRNLSAE